MFENYGTYAKDVLDAARGSFKAARIAQGASALALSSLLIAGIACAGAASYEGSQAELAIAALSKEMPTCSLDIQLSDGGDGEPQAASSISGAPGTGSVAGLSQESIEHAVKDALTDDVLSHAQVQQSGDGTMSVELEAEGGIKVTVILHKGADGEYAIDSARAVIDGQSAIVNDVIADAFAPLEIQIRPDGDENDAKDTRSIVPVAEGISLVLPGGFEEIADDDGNTSSDGKGNGKDGTEKKGKQAARDEVNGTGESGAVGEGSGAEGDGSDGAGQDAVTETYRNEESGQTITVRRESLEESISLLGARTVAQKMSGYWQETTQSLYAGERQQIEGGAAGFSIRFFTIAGSDISGYSGHVEAIDGDRSVTQERIAFVDDATCEMVTVSYRADSESEEPEAGDDGASGESAEPGGAAGRNKEASDGSESIGSIDDGATAGTNGDAGSDEIENEPSGAAFLESLLFHI